VIPEFVPPVVVLPRPNAYDEFRAAASLLTEPPGPSTLAASSRSFDRRASIPTQRRAVRENVRVLAAMRRALPHDYREPPYPATAIARASYGPFRETARLFAAESRVAAADARWDAAASAALDCMEMASKVSRGAALIGGFVSIAMQSIGCAELEPALAHLSPAATARSLARVRRIRTSWQSFADTLAEERDVSRGELFELLHKPGMLAVIALPNSGQSPNIRDEPKEWLHFQAQVTRLAFTSRRRVVAGVDHYYARWMQEARKPWGRGATPKERGIPGDLISQAVLSNGHGFQARWTANEAELAAVETWLAARLYQQRHGTSAPDLAVLRLFYPNLPLDPCSSQPCVYRRIGSAFIVYSLGLDRTDEGGRAVSLRGGYNEDQSGDLVVGKLYGPRRSPADAGSME
jgi:hypothetical protein